SLSRRRLSRTLSSRLPEPTGGHRMTRARIGALPASFALLTLTLARPATTEAPTPKAGRALNMMLREDLAQGFAIHETATISTVWPAMPCFNNLVLFDPLKKTEDRKSVV